MGKPKKSESFVNELLERGKRLRQDAQKITDEQFYETLKAGARIRWTKAAAAGGLFRLFRVERQFSQSDVAKKLGVSTAHLSRVEAGKVVASDRLCVKLAQVLDLDDNATKQLRAESFKRRTGIVIEDLCTRPHVTGDPSDQFGEFVLKRLRALSAPLRHQIVRMIFEVYEAVQGGEK